jgi:chemotaxis protein CheX
MILDALLMQTKLFLIEDMGIEIEHTEIIENSPDKLLLKDYTSMIGTGGKLNLMIIITYEQKILEHLVEIFMEGEEINKEEKEEIYNSVSGETINTIIGLSLPIFPNRGKGITITPPITISDASNIKKYKNAKIVTADIKTKFGSLSVSAMGLYKFN